MARRIFGTIIKKGTNRYRGRYRKNGHDYYTSTVSTKTEAQQLLNLIHADIVRGEWKETLAPKSPDATRKTLTQHIDDFLIYLTKEQVSPNTMRAYKSTLGKYLGKE